MSESRAELEREAVYLHSRFFCQEPAVAVVERYVAANQHCFPDLDPQALRTLRMIVERELDAEAIELVLRMRHRSTVLTRKIQILFYLVEVRAQYYGCFVNQRPGFSRATFHLLGVFLQVAWKFGKGRYLAWRYELV